MTKNVFFLLINHVYILNRAIDYTLNDCLVICFGLELNKHDGLIKKTNYSVYIHCFITELLTYVLILTL